MIGSPAVRWLVIISALALAAAVWTSLRSERMNEIEYRGETIKLTKAFSDYDDYKNNPDNIDPSETTRVQRLLTSAPIAGEFKSRLDIAKAVGQISFPGYGTAASVEQTQPDGSVLAGFAVEIPRAEKVRYFAFRGRDGTYRLIDEFVAASTPPIMRLTEANGQLVYSTMDGRPVLTRAPTRKD